MSSKNFSKPISIVLHFLQLNCNYSLHVSVCLFYFILFTFMFVFNYVFTYVYCTLYSTLQTLFWEKCHINKNLLLNWCIVTNWMNTHETLGYTQLSFMLPVWSPEHMMHYPHSFEWEDLHFHCNIWYGLNLADGEHLLGMFF